MPNAIGIVALLLCLVAADVAEACTVAAGGSARDFIDQSDAIVRARAVDRKGLSTRTFVRRFGRPYWAEMAPVNEELTGPGDPWLGWVREYLALRAQGPAIDGTLPAACDPNMDLRAELLCHFALNDRTPFSVDGYGTLKRFGRYPRTIKLPLPANHTLERVWLVDRTTFVLLVYEVAEAGWGRAEIVRLNPETLQVEWQLPLRGFNASPASIEGNRLYIGTVGAVAAVDLDRGTFLWKHEGLYERDTFAFNAFERPVVRTGEVVFRERTDAKRAPRAIVVDKTSGRIRR